MRRALRRVAPGLGLGWQPEEELAPSAQIHPVAKPVIADAPCHRAKYGALRVPVLRWEIL